MRFSIYRYDPDVDARPRMQEYDIALEPSDRMLLDALTRIKMQDDSVSFRRSCREGVCGSDAMNINGKNGLACITKLADLPEHVTLRPLPGLPVVRDLIVDMTQFFKQYHSIKPYLINNDPPPSTSACNRQKIARSSTVYTNVSCVHAARRRAPRFGGIRTSLLAQLAYCRPTVLLPIRATKPPASDSITWKTRIVCSVATPS